MLPVSTELADIDCALSSQEIVEFAYNVAPTWDEMRLRDAALGRVQDACAMMHLYSVYPFGSKASGLELWNSDIDVVVLGIMEPSMDNLGILAAPEP